MANYPQNSGGMYGYPLPPQAPRRVAPPEWRQYKLITATTSAEVVPQNVFQMLVMVWGGGASGAVGSTSGAGAGFAMCIVDLTPGQLLPVLTVGTVGGTSSLGSLATATGASGITPGTGAVAAGLRGAFTASGGVGISGSGRNGGGASGSPYGNGGAAATAIDLGGSAWGGVVANSTSGATTLLSRSTVISDMVLSIANKRGLTGSGATSASEIPGVGCGGFSPPTNSKSSLSPLGGGGGSGQGTGAGGDGGLGGGGAGSSNGGNAGLGGLGLIVLAWTEGF